MEKRASGTEIQRSGIRSMKNAGFVAAYLVIFDVLAVNVSYFLGLWLRFDLHYSAVPPLFLYSFFKFVPYYTVLCILLFWAMGLYKSLWRFASFNELNRALLAAALTTVCHVAGMTLFITRMPISYFCVGGIVQFFLVTGVRFSYRFVSLLRASSKRRSAGLSNAMIIGAGAAGQVLVRELNTSAETNAVARCVIDDDPEKWGYRLDGVTVVGGRDKILWAVKEYEIDQILCAIPSATAEQRRDILNICNETGCELKSLPGVYQLANGDVSLSKLKPVALEDLLGREQIKVNLEEIFCQLKGRTILVTGGGGSIGSELCRQIAGHAPGRLIIFDVYENNAYDIQQELRRHYPQLALTVLIGSVRDSRRMEQVFRTYRPDIVYHAAAHKHVPLMESSPNESIKNNVLGTYKTAYMALKYGAKRFVLISTDKAVNPTNIMGASKRLCEMVIQSMDAISQSGEYETLPTLWRAEGESGQFVGGTRFVAVRFGNVLGSNGSVVPLFKKQIEDGGPVTVTHPDIIRFFMTIPEAVSLVMQAGTYAQGGEIFVLDMGEPVKIDTMARNLIRLSGYVPDVDIKVEYTGLRPGEKLFEEKLMAEEGLQKTANSLIHIGRPIPLEPASFFAQLTELAADACHNSDDIMDKVARMVPTFHHVM